MIVRNNFASMLVNTTDNLANSTLSFANLGIEGVNVTIDVPDIFRELSNRRRQLRGGFGRGYSMSAFGNSGLFIPPRTTMLQTSVVDFTINGGTITGLTEPITLNFNQQLMPVMICVIWCCSTNRVTFLCRLARLRAAIVGVYPGIMQLAVSLN